MKKQSMFKTLAELRGNPKACVLTEPLWGIPHSLWVPFASVYMLALGVSDVQLGLITSLTLLIRTIAASISGAVADKLGRRRTTILFDLLGWSLPCLLWACAQNVWWFYIAAVCNGFWQLTDNSWTCLLVEDADRHRLVHIYSWIHVAGQLSVFFAPLAGLLVSSLTIIPALRVLYGFSFVSMTAKFIILYIYCEETRIGKVRLEETKGLSLFSVLLGYRTLIPRFFKSRTMLLAATIAVLFTAANTIMDTFFGVYTTKTILVANQSLSLFPIIRSAIMLLFLFVIQPRIIRFGFKGPMLIGVGLYMASHLALILLPSAEGSLLIPTVYTLLQAFAHGMVMPRKDSLVALCLDEQERARMTSIMTVFMLGINIPFGLIAGLLSDLNRSLPFVLNLLLFAIAFAVILSSRKLSRHGGLELQ